MTAPALPLPSLPLPAGGEAVDAALTVWFTEGAELTVHAVDAVLRWITDASADLDIDGGPMIELVRLGDDARDGPQDAGYRVEVALGDTYEPQGSETSLAAALRATVELLADRYAGRAADQAYELEQRRQAAALESHGLGTALPSDADLAAIDAAERAAHHVDAERPR